MQKAVVMRLNAGQKEEYKKRHDEIWPELVAELKAIGIQNYSIHLHEASLLLFAQFDIENPELLEDLPHKAIMKKWWDHMADIMAVNDDNSPVAENLERVFFLE